MAICTANLTDLDSVLEVALSAMPYDPDWNYRYQYRDQYPEDHLKYTKLLFQFFIESSYDDWHVMVAKAPSLEDPNVTKIVAFAVWDVSYVNKRKHGQDYKPQNPMFEVSRVGGATRKDANHERMNVFRDALIKEKKKYFDDTYGDEQIYLHLLGTHSDYKRHGFGSALCKWGMSEAKNNGLTVSLMASPMGFLLYSHLGFKDLGTIIVQVPEEEEKIYLQAMVFEPERKEKDPSSSD